jgi:hypothetical protein
MDPIHFGKLGPDLHQSGNVDPDPHKSEKVKAFRGSFWSIGGSEYGKSE